MATHLLNPMHHLFPMFSFEKGSQYILFVVSPRMSLFSEMPFVL